MSPRPTGRSVERIRALNDLLRSFPIAPMAGQVLITPAITALAPADRAAVLGKVQAFRDFTPDNDPHGEHDFGAVEHAGERYFWKIDYYDLARQYHSPDPADPEVTCRVLTIMRADEY